MLPILASPLNMARTTAAAGSESRLRHLRSRGPLVLQNWQRGREHRRRPSHARPWSMIESSSATRSNILNRFPGSASATTKGQGTTAPTGCRFGARTMYIHGRNVATRRRPTTATSTSTIHGTWADAPAQRQRWLGRLAAAACQLHVDHQRGQRTHHHPPRCVRAAKSTMTCDKIS